MGSHGFLSLLLVIAMGLMGFSQGYDFKVGGRDGWVLNPSENFNHWAGRNRFQVNDSLVFRYKKGEDSVFVVKKQDYDKCNTKNPNSSFNDGYSVFKFDRSGPFYFISGTAGNCEKGQKLIVVVLAVRDKTRSHTPPISPSTSSPPPKSSNSPSPSPSPSSPSLSPSPSSSSISPSPSPSSSTSSPSSSSPTPSSLSPSSISSPSPSPSSLSPPSPSPSPSIMSLTPSPSPSSSSSGPSPSPFSVETPTSSPPVPEVTPAQTPKTEPPPSPPPSSSSGSETGPPSPPNSSASPSLFSLTSGVSLGVLTAVVFGSFVGPF